MIKGISISSSVSFYTTQWKQDKESIGVLSVSILLLSHSFTKIDFAVLSLLW